MDEIRASGWTTRRSSVRTIRRPSSRQYGRIVTRRDRAVDIAIAASVFVLGQLEAWWGVNASHQQGPSWAQAALYAVTSAVLVLRRVHPVICLFVITAVSWVEFASFGSS